MREHRARHAVGDARDEVPAGAAAPQRIRGVGADLVRLRVRAVDGRAEAAHQHKPPVQMPLQGGNVVLRQDALPDLDADLGHVVHDRDEVGIGMVDGDHAARADIAVKPAVRLLEEFAPHLRAHEQCVLRPPVVVGEDLQPVDEPPDIVQPVLCDILDQLVHLAGVLIQARERVFKAHQEVALFKNARPHKAREQVLLAAGRPRRRAAGIPPLRAVCAEVGRVHHLAPARHIRADGHAVFRHRHRAGRVRRPADRRSPAVNARRAALAVAAQIGVDGVGKAHGERLILAQLPLGLPVGAEQLQKYLFRCGHAITPLNTGCRMYRSSSPARSYRQGRSARRRRSRAGRRLPSR